MKKVIWLNGRPWRLAREYDCSCEVKIRTYDHDDGLFYKLQCPECGAASMELVGDIPKSWYKTHI